jgi:hypothetical protein
MQTFYFCLSFTDDRVRNLSERDGAYQFITSSLSVLLFPMKGPNSHNENLNDHSMCISSWSFKCAHNGFTFKHQGQAFIS